MINDECPACEQPIDAKDLYDNSEMDENGYFRCPHCDARLRITEEVYVYYAVDVKWGN